MKILLIDNYDSFTYNLVQIVEEIVNTKISILKNDQLKSYDVTSFDGIIISPGPGIPSEAGDLLEFIKKYYKTIPILGVCLGHQAIGEILNLELKQLENVYHGVDTKLKLENKSPLYIGLQQPITVGRYHSWVIKEQLFPKDLLITSRDENQSIMSFEHKNYPLFGVQYHPESILTPQGKSIIKNWLKTFSKKV